MGELSASLAHEINQPLAAMAANAQAATRMLESAHPDRVQIRDALADIVADGHRASEVIRRLRALFRNEVSERQPLDLNELVTGVATLVHGEVERHGITVTLALEHVNASEALAATDDARRELTVTTGRREAAHARVAVRDSGIGVKDPDTERVFAPFVTSKAGGLGMGLAICRSIIEAHGGRIWAAHNDDRGLTVIVELPAAPGV